MSLALGCVTLQPIQKFLLICGATPVEKLNLGYISYKNEWFLSTLTNALLEVISHKFVDIEPLLFIEMQPIVKKLFERNPQYLSIVVSQ